MSVTLMRTWAKPELFTSAIPLTLTYGRSTSWAAGARSRCRRLEQVAHTCYRARCQTGRIEKDAAQLDVILPPIAEGGDELAEDGHRSGYLGPRDTGLAAQRGDQVVYRSGETPWPWASITNSISARGRSGAGCEDERDELAFHGCGIRISTSPVRDPLGDGWLSAERRWEKCVRGALSPTAFSAMFLRSPWRRNAHVAVLRSLPCRRLCRVGATRWRRRTRVLGRGPRTATRNEG